MRTGKEILDSMGRQASPKRKVRPYLQLGHQLFSLEAAHLVALLLGSIVVSLWLVNSSVTANSLFQSPTSPVTPPEANPPPVEVQPPAEPQPPTPAEPQQPAADQPPAPEQQPPVEQPLDQPQSQQPVEPQTSLDSSAPVPPTQELESPTLMEAEPAAPAPTAGQSRRERAGQEQEQIIAADESPNFILDQAEFIDTVVVSGAYIWLCCGVLLFLLVPLFMLVLYIRGRSKIGRDEGF